MSMLQIKTDIMDSTKESRKRKILRTISALQHMYDVGLLGGSVMPEDENPGLEQGSLENYTYFTLPMALNYQRNSYKLWVSANQTFKDIRTKSVFEPKKVVKMDCEQLKVFLTQYNLALQPNKQTDIWKRICGAIDNLFDGDIRNLFIENKWSIPSILEYVQKINKPLFPYLSGEKICHYWLYVIGEYTNAPFTGKEFLSIVPDTHIIQATLRLELLSGYSESNVRQKVCQVWSELLEETGIIPVDVHTLLWLWSRSGFPDFEDYIQL